MPRPRRQFDYDHDEPLSLAEELADEADRGVLGESQDRYEKIKQGEVHIAELQKLSMGQLIEEARKENVTDVAG
jgi:transcription termination factor Rho